MLQKDRFSTTSSKSGTSKSAAAGLHLRSPVSALKGVGPKIAHSLEAKGIRTIEDLVLYLPRDYQDRSQLKPISQLIAGERALVRGTIRKHRFVYLRGNSRGFTQPLLEAQLDDGSGRVIMLKWFRYNRKFFETKFAEQPSILVYGQIRSFGHNFEIIHPDIDWAGDDSGANAERIVPVYSEIEGVHQKLLRRIIASAVAIGVPKLEEEIPQSILTTQDLLPLKDAVLFLHHPPKNFPTDQLKTFASPAQRRLVFEELFKFEWIIGQKRMNIRKEPTVGFPTNPALGLLGEMERQIPFQLTGDQKVAISKIYDDLAQKKPMNRLLQGDVGCEKTLVALASALPPLAAGAQTVIMAPTEILAEQHFKNALNTVGPILNKNGYSCALLTGSTPKSQRDPLLANLANGKINVLIGTHAVFESPVIFQNLGLVIIDEQHRFGVDQRLKLREKGKNPPHTLSMTATPIPRTLALTAYGDLDITTIKEMPKGRPEIITKVLRPNQRELLYEALRLELKAGRQAYVIYPLVEESEKLDLQNAVDGAEHLANGPLAGFRLGLLHGRMKANDKATVMEQFKKGIVQALVSTTVVEVGVDVPNATVLAIENAERFGLSQLHQLRGRIGRGTELSHCFLITSTNAGPSYERLCAMEETRDGFKLAELDLEIRGPGEFLGTKQSGELQFRYASLVRDKDTLVEARQAAFSLLALDPELRLPENNGLRNYMLRAGHLSQSRYDTA